MQSCQLCLLQLKGVLFNFIVMYPSDKRPLVCLWCCKNREKKRRLDNAVAGMSKILSFFLTTTAGEDETSEGNPENSKRDSVDVAPSVPAEDEAVTEPAPENEAAAEPTTAEPARRGPVVQELDVTLDNPTDRALFH